MCSKKTFQQHYDNMAGGAIRLEVSKTRGGLCLSTLKKGK